MERPFRFRYASVSAFFICLQTATLSAHASAQNPQTTAFQPELTKVFETDSLYMTRGQVSPDGRWIVFEGFPSLSETSLFAISSNGGELHRLTDRGFNDRFPQWSPDGGFVYFSSDRLKGPRSGSSVVMRVPFDTDAGTATDVPRPVTLEPSSRFSISPDGESIAYFRRDSSVVQLRVAPAAGGTARTLLAVESPGRVAWRSDGSHVIYTDRDSEAYARDGTHRERVWQVSLGGGDPVLLSSRTGMVAGFSRSGEEVLWRSPFQVAVPVRYSLTKPTGEVLLSYELPIGVTGDGRFDRELAPTSAESGMPIFVLPLSGEPVRPVTGFGVEGDPLGWLPDGRLLVKTTEESPDTPWWEREATYFAYDVDAGSLTELESLHGLGLESGNATLPGEGSRALVRTNGSLSGGPLGSGSYVIVDLETGSRDTLFESDSGMPGIPGMQSVFGRGGTAGRDLDVFYYLVWQADHRDLYRVDASDVPQRVWTFRGPATSVLTSEAVAVRGDRIAWIEGEDGGPQPRRGAVERVMWGNPLTGESRELHRTQGASGSSLVWSNDGTKLAVAHRGSNGDLELKILAVDSAGQAVGEPETFETGARRTFYGLRWLPGDRAVVLLAWGLVSGIDTDILLIDVSDGGNGTPENLTADDPGFLATFELSPDGRYIAYASEQPAVSTLWRMRLPDVGGRR